MILRIQDEAFRLVLDRGYAATTIEAIAEASDLSPSTVYRTFGTKEGIFLWDELEVPAIEMLDEQLSHHEPVEAVIALAEMMGEAEFHRPEAEMRERSRFLFTEPALRCALSEAFAGFEDTLVGMFTRRGTVGIEEARIIAAAGMAAMRSAVERWAFSDGDESLAGAMRAASASLRTVLNG